jgi:hypothetical protein
LCHLSVAWPETSGIDQHRAVACCNAIISYCAAGRLKESETLLAELEKLEQMHEASVPIRIARARSLARVLALHVNLKRMTDLERLLKGLLRLYKSCYLEATAEWAAEGIANALLGYANLSDTRHSNRLLAELRVLHQAFPNHERIAELLAAGLTNAITACNNSGTVKKIDSLLNELRRLLSQRPERSIASEFSSALLMSCFAYLAANRTDKLTF